MEDEKSRSGSFEFGIGGDKFRDVSFICRDIFNRLKEEDIEVKRRCLITSTNIAKIIGHNPYVTRQELLLAKLGNQVARTTRDITRGRDYEIEALQLFAKLSKFDVRAPSFRGFVRSRKHNFLATSPDAILLDGTLVEVKVPLRFSRGIPALYIPQMQFSMYILQCRKSFYVEYNAERKEIRWQSLDFDNKFIEKHFPAIQNFASVVFSAYKDQIDEIGFSEENLRFIPGKIFWKSLASRVH